MPQNTISAIERGDIANPGVDVVARLEHALDLPRGSLTAPLQPEPALREFLDSDLAKHHLAVTDEEAWILSVSQFGRPSMRRTPYHWAKFLELIRQGSG